MIIAENPGDTSGTGKALIGYIVLGLVAWLVWRAFR